MNSIKKKISIVIPCFNEEKTLEKCVKRVLNIADKNLDVEIIIVDDFSSDRSLEIAQELKKNFSEIKVCQHALNLGKGAALRTGFTQAVGNYVAVQDADLEYDPRDLKKLLEPLIEEKADVVFGSRFLPTGAHRVLYFWHSLGNRFLTLCSNILTDLNLTDMETCYKVFKREVIQNINIQEDRFGFEPEIVAKVAHMRLRIYELGISYSGRTYKEGKKIGVKDGFRALYCILRYNAHKAPQALQFCLYSLLGLFSAFVNLLIFLTLIKAAFTPFVGAGLAFIIISLFNHIPETNLLFRSQVQWNGLTELFLLMSVIIFGALVDGYLTQNFITMGFKVSYAKIFSTLLLIPYNFLNRRFLLYSEKASPSW